MAPLPGRATGPGVLLLVPAAGSGQRMGGVRKPWIELAGRPVLEWALEPFLARDDVVEVVVATADGTLPGETGRRDGRVRGVRGGASRVESVARAFDAARSEADLVAVHDGARPFPPGGALEACIQAAAEGAVAVAGVPAVDTIKRTDEEGRIVETPSRERLWCAQTPQVFPREVFVRALARCRAQGGSPTDDAAMAEALGDVEVRMVRASRRNLKVTSPDDLLIAGAFAEKGLA